MCENCPIGEEPRVEGCGPVPCRVAVIGEAPGATEERSGIPFSGMSGNDLDHKYLPLAGLKRKDVFTDNICACRPPTRSGNRKPPIRAVKACADRLAAKMAEVNPEIVILLGATPIEALAGGLSLKANHGLVFKRELWGKERRVVTMYHPAAGMHDPTKRATIVQDWQMLPERLAQTQDGFRRSIRQTANHYSVKTSLAALDTETDSLGPLHSKMVGVSIAQRDKPAIWARGVSLDNPTMMVVAWNWKYDWHVLRRHGMSYPPSVADGMIAAYLCGEPSLGLKGITKRYLNYEMDSLKPMLEEAERVLLMEHLLSATALDLTKQQRKSLDTTLSSSDPAMALRRRYKLRQVIGQPPIPTVSDVDALMPERLMDYSCDDAEATLQLWPMFQHRMAEYGVSHLFWNVEMPLVPVLADMEVRGLEIDREQCMRLQHEWVNKLLFLQRKLKREVGLENPGSPPQVAHVVYEMLGHKPFAWTDSGAPSTQAWVLERLAEDEPVVRDILEWRKYAKLCSTYLEPWLDSVGRIHPEFNQVRQYGEDAEGATATGRLSSSGPNFQNVPVRTPEGKQVRACIIAGDGNILVSADYRQLEWVLMGVGANSKFIVDSYQDETVDIHAHNAAIIGTDRDTGKRVTYLWIYGGGAGKLAQILGIPREVAQAYLSRFEAGYPDVHEWRWAEVAKAEDRGFATTLWGRRRYIPELASAKNEYEFTEAAKRAFNMFPQGTAADIAKLGTVRVHDALTNMGLISPTTGIIAQVHDECLLEIPESALTSDFVCAIIGALQSAGEQLPITLGVGIKYGKRWGQMQEWKE